LSSHIASLTYSVQSGDAAHGDSKVSNEYNKNNPAVGQPLAENIHICALFYIKQEQENAYYDCGDLDGTGKVLSY
jgi:hypothetical protein